MLEASPAPGGTKAACLLINSKNITVQMLIFSPAIFPFKMLPFLTALQVCFPSEPRRGSAGGAEQSQHPPWVCKSRADPHPSRRMPRARAKDCHVKGKTWLYLLGEKGSDNC